MLRAVEVEFENDNFDHPNEIRDIIDMDADKESATSNNFIYIIYKYHLQKEKTDIALYPTYNGFIKTFIYHYQYLKRAYKL